MKGNSKIAAGTLVSAVASMSLMGAVYIVPNDIDSYKTKTDQSFYDMYQNRDSVIATGANEKLTALTDNIDTSNRIASGSTLNRVGQTNVAGVPVKGGTKGSFVLNGKRYTVTIDKDGDPRLTGYLADGKGHIALKGTNAIKARNEVVVSAGKYDMIKSRVVDEVYFDLPTGTLTTSAVKQQRSYKQGKYGWIPTNQWHAVNIININKKQLGIDELLSNKEIESRSFIAYGDAVIRDDRDRSSNNGKYDS